MTTDHEPSTERGSIENKGGFVSNLPGDVPRVNGQLAVSRAFGDKSLKSHLRSDPDIQNTDINNNTNVLILASDGLWKKIMTIELGTYSYEALPAFKDVPNSEKQNLFFRKLNMCSVAFDFNDPTKNHKEKEVKRQTLVEVVDYFIAANGKFTETVMHEAFTCIPLANEISKFTFKHAFL